MLLRSQRVLLNGGACTCIFYYKKNLNKVCEFPSYIKEAPTICLRSYVLPLEFSTVMPQYIAHRLSTSI